MRIAIISDIHSNLFALRAVLADIYHRHADKIICLGDVVGYGPSPNECVELIKERADICLMGNHDWAVLGNEDLAYFNTFAREAVLWTQVRMSPEAEEYLRALPFIVIENDCTYVHSAPFEPQAWTYVLNRNDAVFQFSALQTQLCFVGHTHAAGIFRQKNESYEFLIENQIYIDDQSKYIINVGSVGQPRDYDARASYGIYDREMKSFAFHRIPYDIESTQYQMQEERLPAYLVDRLSYGR